jgi:hypothetical protein
MKRQKPMQFPGLKIENLLAITEAELNLANAHPIVSVLLC